MNLYYKNECAHTCLYMHAHTDTHIHKLKQTNVPVVLEELTTILRCKVILTGYLRSCLVIVVI